MSKIETFYFNLPSWAQNLCLSTYALFRDKFYRENKFYDEGLGLVKQINAANQEEIEKWQLERINQIVNYVLKNTSFYPQYYGMNKVDIRSFEEFRNLPTIEKQIVRENWDDFQVEVNEKVFKTHTSGTTGSSLELRISAKNTAIERAGYHFSRDIAGYKQGDKLASFVGRKLMNLDQAAPPFWRHNFYDNQLLFSNWHITDDSLPYYIEKYNKYKPEYVNGFPSFLYLFGEFSKRKNLKLHQPKAVFTGSETLMPYQREVIEKAFGCKVFDHYGTAEHLVVAHQCKNGNYHLREELGYLEIIEGEVYGTTFHNTAMPLIRYRIGDLAEMGKEQCSCGLPGRVILNLEGRKDDIIISRKGRKYGRISRIFQETTNVKEAQVIQESLDMLLINIVPQDKESFDLKEVEASVYEKLGADFQIKFNILESIPRTKNGKFRFVISKIPH